MKQNKTKQKTQTDIVPALLSLPAHVFNDQPAV